MLSDRAQILLKTLVERYIADGQPVGSRALSQYSGLDISSATIRNVMVDLEQLGFVASPHTSAGRIPTALGYRFFVDSLMSVQSLENIGLSPGSLPLDSPQRTITAASNLLSQLTHFAGVVVSPRRQDTVLRQIEFLPLSDKRVLLILVTDDGDVQNRIIQTQTAFPAADLIEAAHFLNANCAGKTWRELRLFVETEVRSVKGQLAELLNSAVLYGQSALDHTAEDLVISGERNLLESDDLANNMGRLRQLFELFERKTALLQLMELGNRADGVQIFIGGESGLAPLDECSIITAPYRANGQIIGTLGVIGPTRMAYERIIPIVDVTAKLLSSALSQ
ncbi:heat-inducible transcriptional repressor HrcA [Silvimonas iriomotensis]|uniref:Heat-inducible transcription repressor HrcA n=1 Tax=Silvimonas iriomotensis TaxID=449662 RepID=A0ABQ2P6I2_9NEIS|nr:heat-inducible transcriptional repressor HrcA [Silvimonas iriomotensis]GGP19432.1 heat-inducible transcription repressor HrcA [Silvimonas iriomotensis]